MGREHAGGARCGGPGGKFRRTRDGARPARVLAGGEAGDLGKGSGAAAEDLLSTAPADSASGNGDIQEMHLTPREQEKLLVHVAAEVAQKRRARGLKLNYPEAMAILTAEILEIGR